jgi:hypothetical protein
MTPEQTRAVALKEIEERIKDGRMTKKAQVNYFLFANFGLGMTTTDRILGMLEDLGRIRISPEGEIQSCLT